MRFPRERFGAFPRGRWNRELTAKALDAEGCPQLADELRACERYAVPFNCGCGPVRGLRAAVPIGCHKRICPRCSRKAAAVQALRWGGVARAVLERPVPGYALMLVTVTKRTEPASVFRQERALRRGRTDVWNDSLRRFQRCARRWYRDFWPNEKGEKRRGAGGFGTTELGGNFNWHMHAIVWGRYVPHAELRERWERLSEVRLCRECGFEADPPRQGRSNSDSPTSCLSPGCSRRGEPLEISRSSIVHVKAIRSPRAAVAYLTKYILKPTPIDRPSTHALVEWSLRRSRRILTWGSLYNFPAEPRRRGLGIWCLRCREPLGVDKEYQERWGWVHELDELYLPRGQPRYIPLDMLRNGQTELAEGAVPLRAA